MHSKKTLVVLTIIALGTISLISQNPPAPPDPATMAQHRVGFLTTMLSLTTQQQQQAMAIFTNAASAQGETMKTAHDALRTAVKNNDLAAITQASATIGNLVAEATATQAKADAAFNALLTPDQQAKFTQLEAGGHMRHGGPGMEGFRP